MTYHVALLAVSSPSPRSLHRISCWRQSVSTGNLSSKDCKTALPHLAGKLNLTTSFACAPVWNYSKLSAILAPLQHRRGITHATYPPDKLCHAHSDVLRGQQ